MILDDVCHRGGVGEHDWRLSLPNEGYGHDDLILCRSAKFQSSDFLKKLKLKKKLIS